MNRVLGRSGIRVSEIGFGCWAIGGPFTDSASGGIAVGWHEADEAESAAALRRAFELGITFFDTADVYGTGDSERVLGRALAGHRDEVVIATKFGNTFDPARRTMLTCGGRTLAQGALGWLLARSPRTVPIPGIRTVAQAEQNAAALRLGPLPATAMTEIVRLLAR